MGNLGATELIIIAVVIILLFGAKKLPDMARSLGRSAKILKAETKGLREDDQPQDTPPQQAAPQQLPPAQPQQVVQQPAPQQPQVA
ncbi:MAG: Sec-independent protein translocase subunit TatA, partial [Saccharothrix sp.]|nr:Sec-independent protein translocase subunit TatA [Saccharothrix sp.]